MATSLVGKLATGGANKSDEEEKKRRQIELKIKETALKAVKFFAQNSATIEVVRMNSLEKIHFILLPFCHNFPKETKKEFHDAVPRASKKTKVQGLVDEKTKFIEIAKHELYLNRLFT